MTKLIQKFKYTTIEREHVNGKRYYKCPNGEKLPSVTTILSATKSEDKEKILENWKKRVGESKAKEITEEAANRGTRLHSYLENYVLNGELSNPGSNPYSIQSHNMAKTIIDNGLRHVPESWGVEVPLYREGLYAGSTDFVGVWKDKPAIIDFKQSNKLKKKEYIDDYFLQLTAYSQAFNHMFRTDIRTGVILMCTADLQYQEFVIENEEFDHWTNQWWNKVEKYYTENV